MSTLCVARERLVCTEYNVCECEGECEGDLCVSGFSGGIRETNLEPGWPGTRRKCDSRVLQRISSLPNK